MPPVLCVGGGGLTTRSLWLTDLCFQVPTGTPGGNWCRDLPVRGARNEECVIAGAFDESGAVAWFQLFDVMNTTRSSVAAAMLRCSASRDFGCLRCTFDRLGSRSPAWPGASSGETLPLIRPAVPA